MWWNVPACDVNRIKLVCLIYYLLGIFSLNPILKYGLNTVRYNSRGCCIGYNYLCYKILNDLLLIQNL